MKWISVLVALAFGCCPGALGAAEPWKAADIPVDPALVKGSITYFTHLADLVADGHFKKWVDEFKKIYPNVENVDVKDLTYAPDYRGHMRSLMASGNYGDVVEIMDNVSQSDFEIFYEPLNSIGAQKTNRFPDYFSVNGKYYGFSYGVNAEAVVYNKKLFAKAGIEFPQSRKDLFAACKKLRATGAIPFILNVGLGWTMQQWDREVLVFAGDGDYYRKMLKDDAPFARDKPYGKVLAFVREMIDQGCTELGPASPARIGVPTNWGESRQLMASGKVGMWFLSSWSIAQIVEMAERMHTGMTAADLGFAPLPIDDSGVGKVLMDPDYGIAISAQSTNKETAKAFLYFLLNIADLANASGFIPADVNVPATLPQIAELQRLKPIFIDAKSPPAEFSNAMVAAGFDFMTGTYLRAPLLAKDFDEALDDMNKRWSAAIGKR